jgi:hypothetical protein
MHAWIDQYVCALHCIHIHISYNITALKVLKFNTKLLRSSIDAAHLVDSLDTLGAQSKTDIAVEVLREEALPLQIDFLYLLDAAVRECHHTSLTIGTLAEQVANTGAHHQAIRVAGAVGLQTRRERKRVVDYVCVSERER